ncbi:Wzz/FepE/Etk N-terminal domain-containing protein [Bradyrhizobium sp. RDT10]
MKQSFVSPTNAERESHSREEVFGVWHIAAFLIQNLRTILVFTAATVSAAVIYLLTAQPIFVASTSLIIDTTRGAELFNTVAMPSAMTSDQSRVESQMEVIKSDRVANSVIGRLKLEQRPEFASSPSVVERVLAWVTPTLRASAASEAEQAAPEPARGCITFR